MTDISDKSTGGSCVPVGVPGGINSGIDGVPDGSGIIRVGDELHYVDSDSYRLWRCAAAAPLREELIAWGQRHGIADPDHRIAILEAHGLLVACTSDGASQIGQLVPRLVGECLGNGPDATARYFVRGRDGSGLAVGPFLNELLLLADGSSSSDDLCRAIDVVRPEPRPSTLDMLVDSLPLLIRNEVIMLNRRPQ